jgi:hypothetical protein
LVWQIAPARLRHFNQGFDADQPGSLNVTPALPPPINPQQQRHHRPARQYQFYQRVGCQRLKSHNDSHGTATPTLEKRHRIYRKHHFASLHIYKTVEPAPIRHARLKFFSPRTQCGITQPAQVAR